MAPSIRTRPRFPHSQSLPSESSHKPLIFIHQRANRMKTTITKINQNDHMDHSLSNSMKLWAMPCRATQDRQVIGESSDKTWSSKGENDKPLQYSYCKNPMNSMKRQKDITLEDESSRLEGIQYATRAKPKWKRCPVVDVSGAESKVWCCKI